MDRKAIFISVAVIILILALFFIIMRKDYRTFTWDGDKCVTYDQECTCHGTLMVLESYPPQYRCSGFNFCKDINVTECS